MTYDHYIIIILLYFRQKSPTVRERTLGNVAISQKYNIINDNDYVSYPDNNTACNTFSTNRAGTRVFFFSN